MRLMSRLAFVLIVFFPAVLCKGMTITPTNLTNSVQSGFDAANQSFQVSAGGAGLYSYAVTTNGSVPWLIVASNAVGTGTVFGLHQVRLSYDSSSLSCGVRTGLLTVAGTGVIDPTQVVVEVTLKVINFSVSPANLTNVVLYGCNATSQTFNVSEGGGGGVSFAASADVGWLNVSPTSGSILNGATNTLTNTYLTGSLSGGDYEGHVNVASPDGGGVTGTVRVALRVWPIPVLEASPSLIRQVVDKGGNPTGEYFDVWNASAAPVIGIEYRVAVTNNADNIIQGVLPSEGISTGQHNTVGITFKNLSSFGAGSYTGDVAIVATNYGSGYGGYWTGTNIVKVVLVIAGPGAPAQINASKGAYDNRVALNWYSVSPLAGRPVSYSVLRYTTFDPSSAETIVSGLTVTNYDDMTVSPGVRYYYWARSINIYGETGTNSIKDSGYRRLAAPGGLFASDGEYTNKVMVSWANVDGAGSYYVYRGSAGGSVGVVYYTAGIEFEDNTITEGVEYTYYVQATNSICGSVLSQGEPGYVLGRPTVISASDGEYVDKVVISWNAVHGATAYEIWKSTQTLAPPYGDGAKIAETTSASYNDPAVTPGTKYYYWLKSKNATALSDFSAREEGYAATAAVDLSLWGLVVQPRRIGLGGNPRVISFRLANNGGAALAGNNGTVQLAFYASANDVFGDDDDQMIGIVNEQLTLGTGARGIFRFGGGNVTLPGAAGSYYLFMRLKPVWPSTLAPVSAGGWVTQRSQALEVSDAGSINYQAMNDYDGDGVSDLVVHGGGLWDGRSVDGFDYALSYAFGENGTAVMGDYDGDRKTDPVIYDESRGFWQALLSGSGYARVTGWFGGPGYRDVPGDYDGDGKTDAAVYGTANSVWYALKVGGGRVMWGVQFGNIGYEPVIGDYDGDGVWDLAVYNENNGSWYIRTVAGTLLLNGERWGGPGFSPVAGDYDGDGVWDLAVYDEATGRWYIVNMRREIIAAGILWGAAGYRPVAGDFNGDGLYDLAVYNSSSGKWYIRTVGGSLLLLDSVWGGAGRRAVGGVD